MSEATPVLYINGRFVGAGEAWLSPLDRGFTLADGLFETMVARGHQVFRLKDHLARLQEGASLLELPLPPLEEMARALQETLRRNGLASSVARLTVTRGPDPGRGLALPRHPVPTVVIRVSPRPEPRELPPGLRVIVASPRRNAASPLARVKSLSYTEGVLARLEARRANADDALLLNTRGALVCGTSSNLFLLSGGRLLTPPVSDGALPGICRRTVLELAVRAGVRAAEESLTFADLARAEEAFLTNVVTGLCPVVAVQGQPVGSGAPGPVTKALADAYQGALLAETSGPVMELLDQQEMI